MHLTTSPPSEPLAHQRPALPCLSVRPSCPHLPACPPLGHPGCSPPSPPACLSICLSSLYVFRPQCCQV